MYFASLCRLQGVPLKTKKGFISRSSESTFIYDQDHPTSSQESFVTQNPLASSQQLRIRRRSFQSSEAISAYVKRIDALFPYTIITQHFSDKMSHLKASSKQYSLIKSVRFPHNPGVNRKQHHEHPSPLSPLTTSSKSTFLPKRSQKALTSLEARQKSPSRKRTFILNQQMRAVSPNELSPLRMSQRSPYLRVRASVQTYLDTNDSLLGSSSQTSAPINQGSGSSLINLRSVENDKSLSDSMQRSSRVILKSESIQATVTRIMNLRKESDDIFKQQQQQQKQNLFRRTTSEEDLTSKYFEEETNVGNTLGKELNSQTQPSSQTSKRGSQSILEVEQSQAFDEVPVSMRHISPLLADKDQKIRLQQRRSSLSQTNGVADLTTKKAPVSLRKPLKISIHMLQQRLQMQLKGGGVVGRTETTNIQATQGTSSTQYLGISAMKDIASLQSNSRMTTPDTWQERATTHRGPREPFTSKNLLANYWKLFDKKEKKRKRQSSPHTVEQSSYSKGGNSTSPYIADIILLEEKKRPQSQQKNFFSSSIKHQIRTESRESNLRPPPDIVLAQETHTRSVSRQSASIPESPKSNYGAKKSLSQHRRNSHIQQESNFNSSSMSFRNPQSHSTNRLAQRNYAEGGGETQTMLNMQESPRFGEKPEEKMKVKQKQLLSAKTQKVFPSQITFNTKVLLRHKNTAKSRRGNQTSQDQQLEYTFIKHPRHFARESHLPAFTLRTLTEA